MSLKRNTLICIMLLAVLISIPLVDADEYPSASSAVTAAETQLPQMHFNNSQAKVVVTGELSPEQSAEYAQATAIGQTSASLTIPLGSIIYHADNVTTVFDATGKQLFAADDSQAATLHTFKGDQRRNSISHKVSIPPATGTTDCSTCNDGDPEIHSWEKG